MYVVARWKGRRGGGGVLNLVFYGMYVCTLHIYMYACYFMYVCVHVHVHVFMCKYVYTCIVTANDLLVVHVKINPIMYTCTCGCVCIATG